MRRSIDHYEVVRLAPSFAVIAVWAWWMFHAGGFQPSTWMPTGLILGGILAAAMIGGRRVLPAATNVRRALLVLAAFTAWCFLSLLWSDAPGLAWPAANLLLVALLACWTFALAPWRPGTAMTLMLAFSVFAALACAVALLVALGESNLTVRFEDFRFDPPLDYPNTTGAFGFMALIPALITASRPDLGIVPKLLAQGLATFLGAYALLPQSRGSVLGGLAALAILAITVSFRWRLVMHGVLLALTLVVASDSAGDLYAAASTSGHASGALHDAARTILLVTVFGLISGGALAGAERSVSLDRRGRRAARRLGWALTGLAVLAIAGAGVAKSSAIGDTIHDQWRSLSHPGVDYAGKVANQSSGRLSSIDPLERYDYWRVSMDGFRSNLIGGMGAGGFEHRYTLERRYPKVARYPHNIVVKVAGDTGLVGLALTVGFLVIVALGLRRRKDAESGEVAVTATAAAVLGYFLAHGLFDWLEAYPVLAGPALAFPLVALVVRSRSDQLAAVEAGEPLQRRIDPRRLPRDPRRTAAFAVGGVITALLVTYSLGSPWLAERFRERAIHTWRTDPDAAYSDLRRASSLDPLGTDAQILQGVIAETRGDLNVAKVAFRQSLQRESNWLPHYGLAVAAAAERDLPTARAELARARALNRRDPNLPGLAKVVLHKRPVQPATLIRDALVSPLFATERIN